MNQLKRFGKFSGNSDKYANNSAELRAKIIPRQQSQMMV